MYYSEYSGLYFLTRSQHGCGWSVSPWLSLILSPFMWTLPGSFWFIHIWPPAVMWSRERGSVTRPGGQTSRDVVVSLWSSRWSSALPTAQFRDRIGRVKRETSRFLLLLRYPYGGSPCWLYTFHLHRQLCEFSTFLGLNFPLLGSIEVVWVSLK